MSSFLASFAPNHINLVNACYPPPFILFGSSSTYKPLSGELRDLLHYASSKPGRPTKLGRVLEQRASAEARKARGGNARAWARLLVTVSIFKALANECKSDIDLLSTALLSVTKNSLACLPNNLELQARVTNLFTVWATYTDGAIIGPDIRCTSDYITILKMFRDRCTVTGDDIEIVNRNRLIGLAAVNAAISSDAFFTSSKQFPKLFPKQVDIIIPALTYTLHEVGIHVITDECREISADIPINSSYFLEFQPCPISDRRTASIHAQLNSETRPISDVVNASLRVLRTLLGRCNAAQLSVVFDSILQQFDKRNLWENITIGNWYLEHVIEWAQDQHRYSVPKVLVDKLLRIRVSHSSAKHFALVGMLTWIFTSSKPIVGSLTSDILPSLMKVLLNRIGLDSNDPLLLPLVECISSLGTHVYYADQINELTEGVVNCIVDVQTNWFPMQGRIDGRPAREVALRCLLSCLSGLPNAADVQDIKCDTRLTEKFPSNDQSILTGARAPLRNKVDPEQWQETLPLLCEPDYATRAMYARGLTAFIRGEIEQEPFVRQKERGDEVITGIPNCPNVKAVVDAKFKFWTGSSYLNANSISRFLNALNAAAFSLAMAPWTSSVSKATTIQPSSKEKQDRKQYIILNKLIGNRSFIPTLSDFSLLRQIFTCAHQQVPCCAVLTGVPMLVALGESSKKMEVSIQQVGRIRAIREMMCHLWIIIGEVWNVSIIVEGARIALESLRQSLLPTLSDVPPTGINPPEEPVCFPALLDPLWPEAQGLVDTEVILPALASSPELRAITGLNRPDLLRLFTIKWTVEGAVKDSIGVTPIWDIIRRLDRKSELKKHRRTRRNSTGNSYIPSRRNSLDTDKGLFGGFFHPSTKPSYSPPKPRSLDMSHRPSLVDDENQAKEDQSSDSGSGSGSGELIFAPSRSSLGSKGQYRSEHSLYQSDNFRRGSAGSMIPSSSQSRLSKLFASIDTRAKSRQALGQSTSSSLITRAL